MRMHVIEIKHFVLKYYLSTLLMLTTATIRFLQGKFRSVTFCQRTHNNTHAGAQVYAYRYIHNYIHTCIHAYIHTNNGWPQDFEDTRLLGKLGISVCRRPLRHSCIAFT